jgi:hypothetical protein
VLHRIKERERAPVESSANGGRVVMPEQLRLIKKYPNRRLYDTKTSAYIT